MAVPIFPILAKKMTRRYVYIDSIGIQIVGYILLIVGGRSPLVVTVATILFYLPYQLVFLSTLTTITDAVEYGQLKNGVCNEAVTLSIRLLLDKIAGALSNGLVGFIAMVSGMSGGATASDLTSKVVTTFNMFAFVVPEILMLLAALIFASKFKNKLSKEN
ncbi:MFS transporter [Leuconostoc falkenbergense]|uniref:MFS transporter n=1 Tax=Leuconostoc falkenbergense TaxID=2766470 RepID=A0ABT7S1Q7_9LACO|nr:MFS transporter [Leuconostoc falkenbergense]MDM7647509.1 MFS transporter [Leuconostoc falkenbergense]